MSNNINNINYEKFIMKAKVFLSYSISVLLILFGLTMILGSFIMMAQHNPKYTLTSNLALMIITGIIPLVVGVLFFLNTRKKNRMQLNDQLENIILKLAKANNGKLTAGEVAMNSSLSVEQAKKYLDNLCIKGEVDLFISDSGISVYKFKIIIPEDEKNGAEKL